MAFQINGIYASALGLLAVVLSFHVILYRASSGISLMHGDDPGMIERIRRHGNFMEFVPLALLLLAILSALSIILTIIAMSRWIQSPSRPEYRHTREADL